jgi:hypothetical protein
MGRKAAHLLAAGISDEAVHSATGHDWEHWVRSDGQGRHDTSAGPQVAVQHERLPDAAAADRMKRYWARHLDRLATHLGV